MPRALVVYESFFGNTEQVARAIATTLQEQFDVTVRQADEVQAAGLAGYDLLAIGWAAAKIAKKLASKGAAVVAEPAGFAVLDSEGPLKEGELERAASWAKELLAS